MRRGRLVPIGCLLAGLILSGAALNTSAHGADWPQWLGAARDGVWRDTGLVDKFPAGGPKVLCACRSAWATQDPRSRATGSM